MSLRTIATRMRITAAAALRLSQARAAPKSFLSFQGRPTYGTKDVKMLYRENLQILNGLKEQERAMNKRVLIHKVW